MLIVIAGSTPVAAALNTPLVMEAKIAPVGARVVVMSEVEASTEAAAALRGGAHGFIPLTLEAPVVFQALSYILDGGVYYPPTMLLRNEPGAGPDVSRRSSLDKMRNFTSLEWLILEKLSQAKSNKAIAADLNICEATIKMHIRRIMQKLGVANRTQIALYCANWRRDRDASVERTDRAQ
jgi:DNA-binding NarL/FixJ family response regulator